MQRAEASIEEIRRLNPRVHVQYDSSPITSKDGKYFQDFDVVIATELDLSMLVTICRPLLK
jgi:ubiquitin-like 1-activating enzyme E1 A